MADQTKDNQNPQNRGEQHPQKKGFAAFAETEREIERGNHEASNEEKRGDRENKEKRPDDVGAES